MPTFSDGDSGLSIRNNLNTIINKVEGVTAIDNDIDVTGTVTVDARIVGGSNSSWGNDSQAVKIYAESTDRILDGYRPTNTAGADIFRLYSDNTGTETLHFLIEADGDAFNTNNSYGAISDERLKQDIVNASSQWDDIKAIEIKNYRFRDAVTAQGENALVHLGVVAQQLEGAGMTGLVKTKIDEDTGAETKSVKYSVLYMKAVGALQEAMERIEQLETRIAALEA